MVKKGTVLLGILSTIVLGAFLFSVNVKADVPENKVAEPKITQEENIDLNQEKIIDLKVIELIKNNEVVGVIDEGGVGFEIYFDENNKPLPLTDEQIIENKKILENLNFK